MLTLLPILAAAVQPAAAADIVITATRRPTRALDVPAPVQSVSGARLRDSGAVDIRGLNQLVPSLLVSSSSSEAGGAGARVRGIGTVGDNAGLESSVATYVDGVYRARAAVALTELGPVERIELLPGPQGTLFGRNASAGVIAITTAQPSFTTGGYGEATIGNYAARRLAAGITGPLNDVLAARIDGVAFKRRGFLREIASGRHLNGRDRWLLRGKLLFRPDDTLSATLSADWQRRDEECCAGVYLPGRDLSRVNGAVVAAPSSIAGLIRGFGGQVPDADPFARRVALTPGRSFRQDVEDGGVSLAATKDFGGVQLDSVSAWRTNRFIKGQDGDFGALDLLDRPSDGSGFIRFRQWSQEVRLRGQAGRIDWLVGGYLAGERLTLQDNMAYGADYDRFASARVGLIGGSYAAFPRFGFADLPGFARQMGGDALAALVRPVRLGGTGELDRFRQREATQALFTHDIVALTDRLSLTLGARWTRDAKRLDARLSSSSGCGAWLQSIAGLRGSSLPGAAGLAAQLAPLTGYPCNINALDTSFRERRTEHRWTGSAALGWRVTDQASLFARWSRGYKAGGFNLDRAALFNTATLQALPTRSLGFAPETVDAWEAGGKLALGRVDGALTLFRQRFRNFQLNSYTGTSFIVSNVAGCRTPLGETDSDAVAGNSPCSDTRAGVTATGVELDAGWRPVRDLSLNAALAYADTRYRDDIIGSPDPASGNPSLPPVLFLLPGSRLSNAPATTVTGSVRWTPAIGRLRALVYADARRQGRINTGSDLLAEKAQSAFTFVNARLGLGTADDRWRVELWAQNLFDQDAVQVAFSEPLQGGGSGGLPGTLPAVQRFGTTSTQLFGGLLAEPRTWGLTVRRTF